MAKRRRTARKREAQRWTRAHVRRAFWRAGFGATTAEAAQFRRAGRRATLKHLVEGDGPARLEGPTPSVRGKPLDPANEYHHDVLWWLDRMVRTTRPLEEKMTLFWHDHFATRDVVTPLRLRQNETLRAHALGPFPELLREITLDPAMQLFLSLAGSDKAAPNENFARELMELFTIGTGYTEDDIREAARALTGFKETRANGQTTGVVFDPALHDDGQKTIFGQTGAFNWEDVLRLCIGHRNHAPFLVGKLWSFFAGTRLPTKTRKRLVRTYRSSGMQVGPVVRQILGSERVYRDLAKPDMVKWPVVYVAGQLRAIGAPVDRIEWAHRLASMGQTLFAPPSVAGWDWGARWLSSNAMRARFVAANELLVEGGHAAVADKSTPPGLTVTQHLDLAKSSLGSPVVTPATDRALRRLVEGSAGLDADHLQRALRILLVAGPDNQLH